MAETKCPTCDGPAKRLKFVGRGFEHNPPTKIIYKSTAAQRIAELREECERLRSELTAMRHCTNEAKDG